MIKASRLITTAVLGLVFGVICMLLSRYVYDVAFWPMGIAFLVNHTVLGITIGASALKMNWASHGVFWGILFGAFTAIGSIDTALGPWMALGAVIVWGFLIELLATKVFKQPQ